MGRKLNISTPMVLDVMLAPFTESFQIVPSDTTRQWYYADNSSWSPNHVTNPLILTPVLEVFDPDTKQTYNPTFGDVKWYYLNSSGTFTLITNTTESTSQPYVVYTDGHIKVNYNVPYDSPLTLKCVCPYIDPRASGTSYTAVATIDLTTNRDATLQLPTIDIQCEMTRLYDVIKDNSSVKDFTAVVKKAGADITNSSSIRWYALDKSTGDETLINATTTVDGVTVPVYPCYVSGQNTATLTLDAMFANEITVVARVLCTDSTSPYYNQNYPCKAIRSLKWDDIPVDIITHSNNSGAVRDDTEEMEFTPIVNVRGKAMTDEEKQTHMLFNWKRRNGTVNATQSQSVPVDCGCGQTKKIDGNTLRANASTLVYTEAELLGAYELVTDDGVVVTDGNEPVYDRN